MIRNYFKIAWRNLARHKTTSLINVLGLSIGISACLAIYLIASFELSYDNFHPDKDRIYRVVMNMDNSQGTKSYQAEVAYHDAIAMQNRFTGIDKMAVFFNWYAQVSIPAASGEPKMFYAGDPSKDPSDIVIANPQYFDVFHYQWLAGNPQTALNDPLKVVLTQSRAETYFGNIPVSEMMGKELVYSDSLRVTVSGIVKDFGKNTNFIFNDIISFASIQNSFLKNIGTFKCTGDPGKFLWTDNIQEYVKLNRGTSVAQIAAQTKALMDEDSQQFGNIKGQHRNVYFQSLKDVHFDADYGNDFYTRQASLPALYSLIGIAVFILVIAAINFINISSAQSVHRAKEIGIRKVLGSSRFSLVLQFLTETFITTLCAVAIALLFINPLLKLFSSFVPSGVSVDIFSPLLFIFLAAITIFTALLAGLYPAKVLSSYQPVDSLKGQGKQLNNQKSYLLKGLIVFQFAVSIIFVIGAVFVNRQIHFLLNQDLGFNKDAIVQIDLKTYPQPAITSLLADRLRRLPGVERVSISNSPPSISTASPFFIRRGDNDATILSEARQGDQNYVPVYGLKLLAGRNFSGMTTDTVNEFLVTAACAKQLGFKTPEDAVGTLVARGWLANNVFRTMNKGRIVGVLADFHNQSLYAPEIPVNIINNLKYPSLISVKLAVSKNSSWNEFNANIGAIQAAWKSVFPEEKFDYEFYDRAIASFYQKDEQTSQIMNAAMLIAIFISCIGLFGLVTFTVVQRTKEIGIRKVLGASVAGVTAMLVKEFVFLIGIAFLVATPVTWYFVQKWLQGFASRISLGPGIFVLCGLATLAVALATIGYQSIKAAMANPVQSLRSE